MPKDDLKATWKAEANKKAESDKLASYVAPSAAYEGYETPDDPKQSDWERLVAIARTKFPDHLALKHNLTPKQRRACIAYCLGWTQEKISQLSGTPVSTVGGWLRKEECKDFIKAFQYHTASRDVREFLDGEIYASLEVFKEIRDDVSSRPADRMAAARFFYEAKYGKAKETQEVKGISLRDLTEQLRTAAEDEIFDVKVTATTAKPESN